MKKAMRYNGLSTVMFGLFAVFLVFMSFAGVREYNQEQTDHGEETVSYIEYLQTGHFAEATFENWESEFLQMGAFVLLTAFLVQKGSAESKKPGGDKVDEDPNQHRDDPDAPWPVRQGGLWLRLYQNSLLIAFAVLFGLSILGHALGGAAEFNAEQKSHGEPPGSVASYVTSSQFWFESFQNWQSEFLAVGTIVV